MKYCTVQLNQIREDIANQRDKRVLTVTLKEAYLVLVDNWIGPGIDMTVEFLFISFPTVDFQGMIIKLFRSCLDQ